MSEGLNNNINNNDSFPIMSYNVRSVLIRSIREHDIRRNQELINRINTILQNPNHRARLILNPELVRSLENVIQNNQENNVGNGIV